jgi:hypothetical protein
VVLGYPARDDRNDLALQDRIFGGKYYLKPLQPGVVRKRTKIQSFDNQVNEMTHDGLYARRQLRIIDVDTGSRFILPGNT